MKEKEQEDKNYSKKIFILLLLITLLVVFVISFSFAVFVKTEEGVDNTIESGEISMNYLEKTNGISIENAMPTSDEVGVKQLGENEYFDFTVNSSLVGDVKIVYEIAAIKDVNSTIPDNEIRLYLEQEKSGTYTKVMEPKNFIAESKNTEIGTPKGAMVLKKVTKEREEDDSDKLVKYVDNYRLRMWLGENASISDVRTYAVKVNVYGKTE